MQSKYLNIADTGPYIRRCTSWLCKRRRADRELAAAGKPIQGPRWHIDPVNGVIRYAVSDLDHWLHDRDLPLAPELLPVTPSEAA